MATNTRKSTKPRRQPSNAGQKRPTRAARKMAAPVEETAPEANVERSPAAWARLIDSLVEQRQTADQRLAKLRGQLAPLVLQAEGEVGEKGRATASLQRLRFDTNETASRIRELDDAIGLARVELGKAESKAAAAAREAAREELEGVHQERMALASLIDETLENLGTLVAQWDSSKFVVTGIGRKIHGSENDSAASIGRQLWQGSRRALRYALWKHCPILAELVALPREPARWHQDLATGELYLSSRMLRDGEVDRFERSLQVATPSKEPKESRAECVERLKRPAPDEGELKLQAMRDGLAEEAAEKVEPEADDDSTLAEAAAAGGFVLRG